MPSDCANRIEAYLLAAHGWVRAEDLCAAFNVTKRELRAVGERPGLCSRFAISGNKGFRHIKHCTAAEFSHFCQRVVAHAEGEIARVNDLRTIRAAAMRPVQLSFLTPP